MKNIISPAHMRSSEEQFFSSSGISSSEMMLRAATALSTPAEELLSPGASVCIACGPGGNGGDGYACACLLKDKGYDVHLFASEAPRSSDTKHYAALAESEHIPHGFEGVPALWIDCLYGTGLSRCPSGEAERLIHLMNEDRSKGAKILACDIPSGLNGRTGEAYEVCVRADATLSFHMAKCGHVLRDGLDVCGELIIRDIGFPSEGFDSERVRLIEAVDVTAVLPKRGRNLHKGDCGHLLIVAGSRGMAGAAALCAGAALRSGAGLVSIACPESIVPVLQILEPCAMCIPLPETPQGAIDESAVEALRQSFKGKNAVVCGCGWTRGVSPEILRAILESGLPAVIDADALNILSVHPELKECLTPHHILTPHPGEAARLLGHGVSDPISDAAELCINTCCAVLKGASSVVTDGTDTYICKAGSSAMARGGSGDILTGMIGALLADRKSGRTVIETACAACELHGLAGEAVERKFGRYAAKSKDQIEALAEVFGSYEL